MLINTQDSLETVFSKVKSELRTGVENSKHPYRYAAVATHNSGGAPGLRYVVLRRFINDFDLCFFTDERSQKVQQIRDHSELALLFYNPIEQLQVRVTGPAVIHQGSKFCIDNWQLIAKTGWKTYNSVLAPGARIAHPQDAFSWRDILRWKYFAVVEVAVSACEVLQLNRDEHLRAMFKKSDNGWHSDWLTP